MIVPCRRSSPAVTKPHRFSRDIPRKNRTKQCRNALWHDPVPDGLDFGKAHPAHIEHRIHFGCGQLRGVDPVIGRMHQKEAGAGEGRPQEQPQRPLPKGDMGPITASLSPTSSNSSRAQACSAVSPGSMPPPGVYQKRRSSGARRESGGRPDTRSAAGGSTDRSGARGR